MQSHPFSVFSSVRTTVLTNYRSSEHLFLLFTHNWKDYVESSFFTSLISFLQDEDGNLLETEFGESKYKDHQTITIQVSILKNYAAKLSCTLLAFEFDKH